MPDNRQVQRNGGLSKSSNLSMDSIEEALCRLKIRKNNNQNCGAVAHWSTYPDRPGEPDCIYYLRTGTCGYGDNCRFNHPTYAGQGNQHRGDLPERVGQQECGYFLKTGTCKYGSTCKYHHPRDRRSAGPVSFNIVGLPMRQDEKSCPYYMRTGLCKFGVACKFHHPQPASTGTFLPDPGPAAYGSFSSSVSPSSSQHYTGGFPSTYLSGPRLQGPQTYMPVFLSPPQGILPAQGWNTYLGSMSDVSSSSILGESGTGGQFHLLSTPPPHLPERPDQPECRYFMNTGSCKYGSDCKYHHPREKIAQSASNSLGPLGLPLRPGQAVCSYYNLYGLCKYGPTCKFDHPLVEYSYNYGLGLPALSILDSPVIPYQKNLPTIRSSEKFPSKSTKFPEWIKKLETAGNKNQNPGTITPEDSIEQTASEPDSLQASSEPPHDHSD